MFLLKYLEVKEDEKEVLNIDFIGDREVDERPIFSTLILGENGTGKSLVYNEIRAVHNLPVPLPDGYINLIAVHSVKAIKTKGKIDFNHFKEDMMSFCEVSGINYY